MKIRIFFICCLLPFAFASADNTKGKHSKLKINKCEVGGCSGEQCLEKGNNQLATCEWKEDYRCMKKAVCEVQKNGNCGWTFTKQYYDCIKGPTSDLNNNKNK